MGIPTSFGTEPGRPLIDAATCNHCGLCAEVCPALVLKKKEGRILVEADQGLGCVGCAQCAMVCPRGGITVSGRRTKPEDLIPLPGGEPAGFAALEALLAARRSVRLFRDEPVPPEAVERILAFAALAPMGIPPWDVGVTVFLGRDKVRQLAAAGAETYRRLFKLLGRPAVLALLRPFMKKETYAQWKGFIVPLAGIIAARSQLGEDRVLYDAPGALLFHASAYADGADSFIACTYAMIAAEALGLGACQIGCLPPVLRGASARKKFGIPAGQVPKIVLLLGYPRVRFQRTIRRPFHSISYA